MQIIWEIIPEISSSIIPKRNIPESSSEEEKVAAMGNWSSMWMDMLWESVKQPQNCPHRGVRELGCLSTYSHPALIFLFLASRHGMQDLSSPNQGWNSCPPAVEVQSLNHWTIREAPIPHFWGLFLAHTGEFSVCSQLPSRRYWNGKTQMNKEGQDTLMYSLTSLKFLKRKEWVHRIHYSTPNSLCRIWYAISKQ